MIQKHRHTYTPVCDGCGTELPEEWDWYDALGAMQLAGWRNIPPEGVVTTWTHLCPACAVKEARADFD